MSTKRTGKLTVTVKNGKILMPFMDCGNFTIPPSLSCKIVKALYSIKDLQPTTKLTVIVEFENQQNTTTTHP